MESLNEHDSMRVLQAAAAMDAMRNPGSRPVALTPGRQSLPPHLLHQPQQQQQKSSNGESPPYPPMAVPADDIWREMAEKEGGQQKRQGDLDSWLDVFRATAGSLRNAWRTGAALTFESVAFGWLALARKHDPLPCAPPVAIGEEVTDTNLIANWRSEAHWAQAAYQLAAANKAAEVTMSEDSKQRLVQLLGLEESSDLLAWCLEPAGCRPAFFLAVHHGSRAIRLVIRGSGSLPELLNPPASGSSALGPGFAHRGMLEAAQRLLDDVADRLRAAVEAHPGYELRCIGHSEGAGIAALLAILVALEGPSGAGRLGSPEGGLRATCFSPPTLITSELVESHVGCINSVIYNADLVSRCSSASLRRLGSEISLASREMLSRSDLAQALRRSGALGLANHVVAAALCRCQPPQDTPSCSLGSTTSLMGMGSRNHLVEGLTSLSNPLTRPPPVSTAVVIPQLGTSTPMVPPAALKAQTSLPPGGRLNQLATIGTPLKVGSTAVTPLEPLVVIKRSLSGGASPVHVGPLLHPPLTPPASAQLPPPMPPPPPPPLPPPAAPPVPAGIINVTLPPLNTVPSIALGTSSSVTGNVPNCLVTARGSGFDSPRRRLTDVQSTFGVLLPPPLVAAAAAAAASTQSQQTAVVAAAARGPTPPRRVLTSVSVELREPRATTAAAAVCALAPSSDDGSSFAGNGGGVGGSGSPGQLSPLQSPGLLIPGSGSTSPGALPPPLSVPSLSVARRDMASTADGPMVAAASAVAALPHLLPPMLPLPLAIPGIAPQSSPRVARHISYLETQELREHTEPVSDRSMRSIPQLPLPLLHLQQLQQLQQLQMLQTLRTGLDTDRPGDGADEGPELLIPGAVYLIERRGVDANATFRLLRGVNRSQLNRILLKRSMLRDHLLSHYVAALDRILPH